MTVPTLAEWLEEWSAVPPRPADHPVARPASHPRHAPARRRRTVKVVSERLGHTEVAMAFDVYAHVLPPMDRAAADVFGDLLADPATTTDGVR